MRSTAFRAFAFLAAILAGATLAFVVVANNPRERLVTLEAILPGQAPWQKQCFKNGDSSSELTFGRSRVYEGIWRPGFEQSSFKETDAAGNVISGDQRIWLGTEKANGFPEWNPTSGHSEYFVELIGSEPLCDKLGVGGGFGHMGGSDRLVVAQKLIRISPRK